MLPSSAIVTGLTYGVTVVGWVPDYEIYSAMRHAGYNESEWAALPWRARARAVAHLRVSHAVALHESDAVVRASRAAHPPG